MYYCYLYNLLKHILWIFIINVIILPSMVMSSVSNFIHFIIFLILIKRNKIYCLILKAFMRCICYPSLPFYLGLPAKLYSFSSWASLPYNYLYHFLPNLVLPMVALFIFHLLVICSCFTCLFFCFIFHHLLQPYTFTCLIFPWPTWPFSFST